MLDVNDLGRPRAGSVDHWVRVVVWLAVIATFVVLFIAPRLVLARDASSIDIPAVWFENALAFGFTVLVALIALPDARGSRYVRVAVLLPLVQIVMMVAAWTAWTALQHQMPSAVDSTPLVARLPLDAVLVVLAIAMPCGGALVARRGRREVLHATTMVALLYVLLLGMWLPFAASTWDGNGLNEWMELERSFAFPTRMITACLVPPFVAALAIAALVLRRRAVTRLQIALLVVLFGAIAVRAGTNELGALVYINFVHVLGCAALVALASIVTLGLAIWSAAWRARRALAASRLVGTVVDREPVATLQVTSWLRGLAPQSTSFSVLTPHGEVPVPAGARVAVPTPLASTLLRTGEQLATLRGGDRVTLAGYASGHGDGPFRETSAPIATGVVIVGRTDDEPLGLRHVALELWRPSIAYLVICVAVALPALAALLTDRF